MDAGKNSARTDTSDWPNAHEYYKTTQEVAHFQVRFQQTIKWLKVTHEFLLLIEVSTNVPQHNISFHTQQCRRQHGSSRDWQRGNTMVIQHFFMLIFIATTHLTTVVVAISAFGDMYPEEYRCWPIFVKWLPCPRLHLQFILAAWSTLMHNFSWTEDDW